MPTINATAGSPNANSYLTVSDAQSYMGERLNTSDWDNASTDEQEAALISATRRLDQEHWEGTRTDPDPADQALEWPRNNTEDQNGHVYDNDIIPQPIKDATAELALAMLGEDLLSDTGLEGFEEVEIGPLQVTPRHMQEAGELPENVKREVEFLLISRSNNVRLDRA